MKAMDKYSFWFVAGTQAMYGPQVIETVDARASEMSGVMDASLPCNLIYKATVKSESEITQLMKDANHDDSCAGVVVWMHTFSPAKMWLTGLNLLQKPYLHLHTQYGRNIPNEGIDMDYMNLNQSAHGDREHGFMAARLRTPRKVVVGFWQDAAVAREMGDWMRVAVAACESRNLRVVRFGDNMRNVAVTEGDKIEAQRAFGWQVNTHAVGDLCIAIDQVPESDIDAKMAEYQSRYAMNTEDTASVRWQARAEVAIERFLHQEGAAAFTDTIEDLHGLEQLPGLATQNLMRSGFGFGGEGDWKTAALCRVMKVMGEDLCGGTGFMEDYTYDLEPGSELSLGAHMLEVCPTFAGDTPRIEVHPLSIGGKAPPARLVFEGKAGPAIIATLCDMGGRMRLIVHELECVTPTLKMPNLPVARLMWKPLPNFAIGTAAWILAGGGHHAVLSYELTAAMMADWAEMMGVECIHIGPNTDLEGLKRDLFLADLAWKLK